MLNVISIEMTNGDQSESVDLVLAVGNIEASKHVESFNAFNRILNVLRENHDVQHGFLTMSADNIQQPVVIGDFSFESPGNTLGSNDDVLTLLKSTLNLHWRSIEVENNDQQQKKIVVLLTDRFLCSSLTENDQESYVCSPCSHCTNIYQISSELARKGIRLIVTGMDEDKMNKNADVCRQISQMTNVTFVSLNNLENFILDFCNNVTPSAMNDENISDIDWSVILPQIPRSKPIAIPIAKQINQNDEIIIGKPDNEHFIF